MNSSVLLSSQVAQQFKQARGNPIANLVPISLTRAINNFEYGWLRDLDLIYQRLENGADFEIADCGPKRRAAVAGLDWDVVIDQRARNEKEAGRHKEALSYFFYNLTVRNAVEPDEEGEVDALIDNTLKALFVRYSVHEILWQGHGADLTAQLVHAPVSLFEATTGPLRYAGPTGGVGQFELEREGWVVAKGRTLSMGLGLAWMFSSMSLGDWLEYNQNFALPGIHGVTDHAEGTPEFNAFQSALDAMVARFRVITGKGNVVNVIESQSSGGAAHDPLYEIMKKAKITLCMGSDLSTSSAHNSQGASVQMVSEHKRIAGDARFVEGLLNRRLVRQVIEHVFGPGVAPLAWFRIKVPNPKEESARIQVHEFLIKNGVPVSIAQLAEDYGHSLPREGAELVKPAAAAPKPGAGRRGQGGQQDPAAEPDEVQTDNAEPSLITPQIRAALLADLEPLRIQFAAALQDPGKIADLDLSPLKAVLENEALTEELSGQFLVLVLMAWGASQQAAEAVLKAAAAEVAAESKAAPQA